MTTTKQKIDLRNAGDITLNTVMSPEDFSLSIVFNGCAAVQMTFEQWQRFVKEVMRIYGTGR